MLQPRIDRKRLVLAWAVLLSLAAQPAFGAAPRRSWYTVVTPRFRVHYHEGTEDLAIRMAGVAENVLPELARILGGWPETPIHVVITDEMDGPQGYAEILPRNIVTLFPAVPPPTSELGDYDDFMRLLLIHELAHIVHLDTIGGIPRAFNQVFGKQWSPNVIQPRWVIEGIATNLESHFTSGGRVRSSYVDMVVRAQVLDDVFPPLDDLSNVNRRFLFGTFPWILGGRFLDFIGRSYGESAIARISQEYGTRPLPYALNLITEQATERTMVDLHAEWEAEETRRANEIVARVRAEGVRAGTRLPRPSAVVRYPVFAPTGALAFLEQPRDGDDELVVLAPDLETELLRLRTSSGRATFTPDGRWLVATLTDNFERVYSYTDLEVIHVETGQRWKRTYGARLQEPDLSPDGRTIVAVQQEAGRTWLATLPLRGRRPPKLLFAPGQGAQVATPEWSPDGGRIAFSLKVPSGARHLAILTRSTGEVEVMTNGLSHDFDPCWSPDGSQVFFVSDRGGVFNIYRLDLATRGLHKVTNVETGALDPAISPDGRTLFYSKNHAFGFDLMRFPLGEAPLPADPPLVRPAATASAALGAYPVETYSPWETLLPKAWLPTTGLDGVGDTVGIEVTGADALRQHSYSLGVHYGIESKRLGYGFSYLNSQLWMPISLSSSLVATTRPGRFVPTVPKQDQLQSIFRFSVGLSVPLGRWDTAHSISFSYNGELRRGLTLLSDDPFQPAPPINPNLTLSSVSVTWGLNQVRAFPESISPAAGQAFSVTLRLNDPLIGSDFRVLEAIGRWNLYLTMPWLEHHVVAARLSVGGSAGDLRGRSVYTLGGLPVRNILSDALDGIGVSGDVIRGYPQAVLRGNAFYLVNLEYRFPLWVIATGVETIPFFFDRLYAAAFVDAGATPNFEIALEETRAGAGAELRLDLRLGYVEGYTLRFGYARGFTEEGVHNVYLVLGGLY